MARRRMATTGGLIWIVMAGFVLPALAQKNPVPFVNQPLVPDAVAPGSAGFTLTVNGTGFVSGAVVDWNGVALATTFVSSSQLTATVPAADVATAGTAQVSVVNPAPGGGTSGASPFEITVSTPFVLFGSAKSSAAGNSPDGLAAADFNGDGKMDLAAANNETTNSAVTVVEGDGDGTFQAPVMYPAEVDPFSVITADFNGDGRLDLAAVNVCGTSTCYGQNPPGSVSILLGNSDGTFQAQTAYGTGDSPFGLATGDFNRDGNLDLVVADQDCVSGTCGQGAVSVLLGNGDGTFRAATSYPTGLAPQSVTIGDFNGDGKLDLATGNTAGNTISILVGNGDGTFRAAGTYNTGSSPTNIISADLNRDGVLDLATSSFGDNTVSILLGRGDGTFQKAAAYATGEAPVSMSMADYNGDGIPDLATSDQSSGSVSLLLGNGDGTFQSRIGVAAGSTPVWVTTADFNGDGRLDVVASNLYGNSVSALLQVPAITISPTSLTFAGQKVGTTSSPQTVTLSNSGSAPLTISSIILGGADSNDFAQTNNCTAGIQPSLGCLLNVTFTPTMQGTRTATLTVTGNASTVSQTVSLSGTGIGVPAITLSPTSLTFATQLVFTQSPPQVVTLTNSGSGALTLTSIAATGQFTETNTCGSSISPGASCTLTVTFKPVSKGTLTGSVTITDNAPGSPQTVSLTGTGTFVELTPTSENFGSQPVHTASLPKKIVLTNKGSSAVSIANIGIAGAAPGDFAQTNTCGSSVASGASCFITVSFTPTALGQRTANVSIIDNAGGSPQQVGLIGLGTL